MYIDDNANHFFYALAAAISFLLLTAFDLLSLTNFLRAAFYKPNLCVPNLFLMTYAIFLFNTLEAVWTPCLTFKVEAKTELLAFAFLVAY